MAIQSKFAVGDIVKVKSGDPEMTVQTLPEPPAKSYRCQWFAGKNQRQAPFLPIRLS